MTDLAPATDRARVSTLELFFDLVFVFTVTQITEVVDHHPDITGIGQGLMLLVVLYWMYGGFAWLTNAMGTDGTAQRLTVLVGMAALFVCSQAVPEAFDESGIAMGIAYLSLTVLHLAGFRWLGGSSSNVATGRLARLNVTAGLLVLAAGWTNGWADWLLWGAATALFLGELVRTSVAGRFVVQPSHFAERHGLMIIIVLGESVISVALAAREQHLDLRLVTGCLLGIAAVVALWWAYFVGDDEAAAVRLRAAQGPALARLALVGYDLTHMVMIAGVIGVAAGTRLGLADLLGQSEPAGAWLIAGGAATFLAATAVFRGILGFAAPLPRAVGAAVLLATAPIGIYLGAAQQLGVVAVVVGVTIAAGRPARRVSIDAA